MTVTSTTTDTVSSSIRRPRRPTIPIVQVVPIFVVFASITPFFASTSSLFVWTTAAIWVLFALATNVLFGWSGMLSFGQAAYLGVGGYTVALLQDSGLPPILMVVCGGLSAAAIAAVFSTVALRTSGVEFAVLTLVFSQVLWLLTFRVKSLRGDDGFGGLSEGTIFGAELADDTNRFFYIVAMVGLCVFILLRLRQSTLGASMAAVRDDPLRAAALGLPVRRIKILAFSIAGGFTGIAGGLLAQHQGTISPRLFSWLISGEVIVACLIGGMAYFWGPAMGALVFIFANDLLFGATNSPTFYIGLVFLVVVIALPGGLGSLPKVFRSSRLGRIALGRTRDVRQRSSEAQPNQASESQGEDPS
ncbi:MAG: branched-chain amino acid transport system permease protein [Minisyncoccia bacterium]|jgi:branched-chain amino acid transport system permease protein